MNDRVIFIVTGKATETLIGVNMLINYPGGKPG